SPNTQPYTLSLHDALPILEALLLRRKIPARCACPLQNGGGAAGDLLLNFPGVAGAKEFREIALTALGDDLGNLRVHDVLVAREIVPGAQDAERSRESRPVFHVREQEGIGGPGVMRVVDHEILFRDT